METEDAKGKTAEVLLEVAHERASQRDRGWSPSHDDEHSPAEWVAILAREVGTMGYAAMHPEPWWAGGRTSMPDLAPGFRRALVRACAISVAAIEAFDRRLG